MSLGDKLEEHDAAGNKQGEGGEREKESQAKWIRKIENKSKQKVPEQARDAPKINQK